MQIRITWRNDNPTTIYNRLAARLQREPTLAEVRAEVSRILRDVTIARAGKGQLPHQRKR